jgi:acyl dehydratase
MNVSALLNHAFPKITHTYTRHDTSRYALSVGFGFDPLDEKQLSYVYGDSVQAVGSMALVLANQGFWLNQSWTGVDWVRVLHGQQTLTLHAPLPAEGTVCSQLRILRIIDKGKSKGAYIVSERDIIDLKGERLLATLTGVSICRGDGGFGGADEPIPTVAAPPSRSADITCSIPTIPQAALLYDLNGIVNPVHSWPPAARQAGYERPFLHGTCTMGIIHHGLSRALVNYECDRVTTLSTRFIKEFYPGETLDLMIWTEAEAVTYEAWSHERTVKVAVGDAVLKTNLYPPKNKV